MRRLQPRHDGRKSGESGGQISSFGGSVGNNMELMERAMGIEIIAAWFFKDLQSRARTDLEGLGILRSPYCRLDKLN